MRSAFKKKALLERKEWQEKYLRHLFPFFGVAKPVISLVEKEAFKLYPQKSEEQLHETVLALWKEQEREFHYVALDLLLKEKKLWSDKTFILIEKLIRDKSWWDSVDPLASCHLGAFLQKFPEKLSYMDKWIQDKDFWIQRSALIFQLKYKEKTDEKALFRYALTLGAEKEFFIRKAIGWALREHGKRYPQQVADFLKEHKNSLSALSVREAKKYLGNHYV